MEPSVYQSAIWEHFEVKTNNLVVQALAGSGKSTTLVHGLSRLRGQILLTSFGRDIVADLKAKVAGRGVRARVQGMHALGMKTIGRYFKLDGQEPDRGKVRRHAKDTLREFGIEPTYPAVKALSKAVEWGKSTMISSPDQALSALRKLNISITVKRQVELAGAFGTQHDEEVVPIMTVADMVVNSLNRNAKDVTSYDFDDMIWLPLVYQIPLEPFDVVLCDEVQDFSPAQIQFTRGLARVGRIIAVGDENQALYAFRGADTEAMKRMVYGLDADTLPLSICYRCPRLVVEEAQRYVPEIEAAPHAEDGQVQRLDINHLIDMVDPGDVIISRVNRPLAILANEFRRRKIPVIQLGNDRLERIVDLISTSKATEVEPFTRWTVKYLERRRKALSDAPDVFLEVRDIVETTLEYCHGRTSMQDVVAYARSLYAEEYNGTSVVLSTAHRAKGKEWDSVFLLWKTFRPDMGKEEKNITYVATTRAKKKLYYVQGDAVTYFTCGEGSEQE